VGNPKKVDPQISKFDTDFFGFFAIIKDIVLWAFNEVSLTLNGLQ
jgi:hypothetical protein